MKAKEVMTTRVITVAPHDSVLTAARLMLKNRVSGLPVIDNQGRLVGMVTEGDFLRRAATTTGRRRPRWLEFVLKPDRMAKEYTQLHARKVEEVMTVPPLAITEETPLAAAVEMMERKRIKRLPVLRGNRVVGLVSRASLLHAFATISPRERQVLEGVVAGRPNKAIALDLGISPRTVEIYRANVMTKMGATSLSDLVRMALMAGILDSAEG